MYGFFRFRNMDDVRLMVVALNNIFIKGCLLHANIPRFKRDGIRNKQGFETRNNMKSGNSKNTYGRSRGIDMPGFGRMQNNECENDKKKSYAQFFHNTVTD